MAVNGTRGEKQPVSYDENPTPVCLTLQKIACKESGRLEKYVASPVWGQGDLEKKIVRDGRVRISFSM